MRTSNPPEASGSVPAIADGTPRNNVPTDSGALRLADAFANLTPLRIGLQGLAMLDACTRGKPTPFTLMRWKNADLVLTVRLAP